MVILALVIIALLGYAFVGGVAYVMLTAWKGEDEEHVVNACFWPLLVIALTFYVAIRGGMQAARVLTRSRIPSARVVGGTERR